MKNFISITILVLSLIGIANAHATCSSIGCQGKISKLYMANQDYMYIAMDQDTQPLVDAYSAGVSGCLPVSRSSTFSGYFKLNKSHQLFEEIFSTMLASKMNDNSIFLRISSGVEGCTVQYAVSG